MIHGHGNDLANYQTDIIADFSSNIWYGGMDAQLHRFLSEHITNLANYPEVDASSLKQNIVTHHAVNYEHVTAFNGSTEAFYTIAQAFSGKTSNIIIPCFSEYADACRINNHKINYVESESNWQSYDFSNQLVWLANPNNPDGKTLSLTEIKNLLISNESAIFILDEAYIDLCFGVETAIPLLLHHQNLIIIRSLTKAFVVPGIRLGYILTNKHITNTISPFIRPWSVNGLAIIAGNFILTNYQNLLPSKEEILTETTDFQRQLAAIHSLKIYPSKANYFLVKTTTQTASHLKSHLINQHKMLIRDASNFKGLGDGYFRLAIRGQEHNKQLIMAINQWVKNAIDEQF